MYSSNRIADGRGFGSGAGIDLTLTHFRAIQGMSGGAAFVLANRPPFFGMLSNFGAAQRPKCERPGWAYQGNQR
jgi:hypothetical protein